MFDQIKWIDLCPACSPGFTDTRDNVHDRFFADPAAHRAPVDDCQSRMSQFQPADATPPRLVDTLEFHSRNHAREFCRVGIRTGVPSFFSSLSLRRRRPRHRASSIMNFKLFSPESGERAARTGSIPRYSASCAPFQSLSCLDNMKFFLPAFRLPVSYVLFSFPAPLVREYGRRRRRPVSVNCATVLGDIRCFDGVLFRLVKRFVAFIFSTLFRIIFNCYCYF